MLSPAEWLARVGFSEGNPFALKWAEDECDRLHEYFVDHQVYHAIIDTGSARSTILHAPRGVGKSSTRRMFEAYCQAHESRLRALLLPLIDWMPLVERAAGSVIGPRDLLAELLRLFVVALAELPESVATPLPPDEGGYLRWICMTYADYLRPSRRATLAMRGWLPPPDWPAAEAELYRLDDLPVLSCFELIARISAAIGCACCYVVVDGVDELCVTSGDWHAGADLLAPLLGNLRLLEVPGLAFKAFVPSDVVAVLRKRGMLREDRVAILELSWTPPLLNELLRSRLTVFSEGAVPSLALLAVPELADLDQQLCAASAGSPRALLKLGEQLIQACARGASDDDLLLRPVHLREALAATGLTAVTAPGLPLLRLESDGTAWIGPRMVEGSRELTALQRRLLSYLYAQRGKICSTDELIAHVWSLDRQPSDPKSLHNLVNRLIEQIEPDPTSPRYIERRRGGAYVLRNSE
jgi:hypothetical protein